MKNYYKIIFTLYLISNTRQNLTELFRPLYFDSKAYRTWTSGSNWTEIRRHVMKCRFFNEIRYRIHFRHDNYATLVPFESDRHIYIDNVCSGALPEHVTNFGLNSSTYSMTDSSCKQVHVRLICPQSRIIPDYIPRNYEFKCTFNCSKLQSKSLECVRNNVIITLQLPVMDLNFGYNPWTLKPVNQAYFNENFSSNATVNKETSWQKMEKSQLQNGSFIMKTTRSGVLSPILTDLVLVL